ncbi:DUF6361 family protein [Desulfonatronum thioautotrophicum]|uniref:DUF6361 family protein n=1 Tax=Desulfonatronum thioautotrophicum TaxID=617001 RepID=UPI0005EBB9BC|nr:DUF6361 family protein [Desulfonatronum thioautotrophicum]
MPSTLSWIDHDTAARERTLRILSLFQERETRDELGLGSVRDSFADQLFPGTSTIQTRLRYMLFVPWIYKSLEDRKVPSSSFAQQADKIERSLITPLLASDDQAGVFGKTAGGSLKRLPSSVYWSGLGAWGIRTMDLSQDEYHRRIDQIHELRRSLKEEEKLTRARGDDVDIEARRQTETWHPGLPPIPDGFPSQADFALTRQEAEFIRDRIRISAPQSLLSFLTLHGKPTDVAFPWEHPDLGSFLDAHKLLMAHARLFSESMHGAALVYNYQLAKVRSSDDLADTHAQSFQKWKETLPLGDIHAWDLNALWEATKIDGQAIHPRTQDFVRSWINLVRLHAGDLLHNAEAAQLIRLREMWLKKGRSRFSNQRALEQWGGKSGTARLAYRWSNVKTLLDDLYQGLKGGGHA